MAATQGRYQARDQSDVADALILEPVTGGRNRWTQISLRPCARIGGITAAPFRQGSEDGYHNRQFAGKLFEIGLCDSDTANREADRLDRG